MKDVIMYLAFIDSEPEKHKFEQLYMQYKNLMFYTAKELLQDDHLAEDAVSATFMQVAKNMHKIGAVEDKKTKWLLLTIVERTAINMYHKRRKEQQNNTALIDNVHLHGGHTHDATNDVAEAILKLSPDYQQVMMLKYVHGYKSKEIAAMLGYSVSKVDQLMSRGRKQLLKFLEEV